MAKEAALLRRIGSVNPRSDAAELEAEQVDELVLIFGIVPLAIALIVIYLSTWLAYRVSRRAVSRTGCSRMSRRGAWRAQKSVRGSTKKQ